jgi:hypothetical protein
MANKKGTKQTAEDIVALKGIAIAAAEMVYHYKLIARAINRDEDTLLSWRTDDTDFSDSLEQGRHRFIEKNVKAARPEFLLERLEPELFKERKELDNHINGNVSFINDVPRPTKD